jgi:hypothetical protein
MWYHNNDRNLESKVVSQRESPQKKKIKSYRNLQNVFMHIKIDVLDFIQKTCMLSTREA